jgi:hypothetical protein
MTPKSKALGISTSALAMQAVSATIGLESDRRQLTSREVRMHHFDKIAGNWTVICNAAPPTIAGGKATDSVPAVCLCVCVCVCAFYVIILNSFCYGCNLTHRHQHHKTNFNIYIFIYIYTCSPTYIPHIQTVCAKRECIQPD